MNDTPECAAQIRADAELPSLAPPGRDLTEPLGRCNTIGDEGLHARLPQCRGWVADPWEAAAEAKQEDDDD